MNNKRRDFIKKAALGTAGLAAISPISTLSAKSYNQIIGANNRIIVGGVGFNGQGANLLRGASKIKDVRVEYLCDVDSRVLAKMTAELKRDFNTKAKGFEDYRKMFQKKEIDAVIIATPDHMHAPIGIAAAVAGKHIYVEKPCSHNPAEGELFVKAQKKYGVQIQMGNQQRSFPLSQRIIKLIHDGLIGDVYYGKAWYANGRGSIGKGKKVPVPSWLNWDLYQGVAPRGDFRSNLVHYNWHWFWKYGTGEINNNGAHEIDICRWALGVDFPTKVTSAGGRFAYDDDWEFYDTQTASFEFGADKMINWEGTSCNKKGFMNGRGRGAAIYGTNGTVIIDRASYEHYDKEGELVKVERTGQAASTSELTGRAEKKPGHIENLMNAIRDGQKLNSPIAEGHISITLCHLGNIAQKTGTTLHTDPKNGHIKDNLKAEAMWSRDYEKGWKPTI